MTGKGANMKIFALAAALTLLSLSVSAGGFICTEDPVWKEYSTGVRENLEGATVYPDSAACADGCIVNYECQEGSSEIEKTVGSYGLLDQEAAEDLNGKIHYMDITGFGLYQDGVRYWFAEGVRASSFDFPRLNDDDFNSWINAYGETTTIPAEDGAKIEIVFTPTSDDDPTISGNGSNNVVIAFGARKTWRIDHIDRYGNRRKSGTDSYTYLAVTKSEEQYHYCPVSRYSDLGGDLQSGTAFSQKPECDVVCRMEKPCVEKPSDNCHITAEEVSHPVTDYTGKTVYTRKTYVITCDENRTVTVGCGRYEIRRDGGDFPVNIEAIGYETKDFSAAFEDSVALVSMMEQMQHIWSGWKGYCEHGWLYDDSWMSDPMTLLSYAMMAYGAAADGVFGDTAKSAIEETENYFKELAQSWDGTLQVSSETEMLARLNDPSTTAYLGTTVKEVTEEAAKSMYEQIKDFNNIKQLHLWEDQYVRWSDIAQIAAGAMAEPEDKDFRSATDFMRTAMGAVSADDAALSYRQCMASIGLSVPNMFSWAADLNSTSSALVSPVNNPIRLTKEQLAALVFATSEEYVKTAYAVLDKRGDVYTIVAVDGVAYTQAGRAICAGPQVSKAMNAQEQASKKKEGGINTGAMTNAAIQAALGHLPPPYNIVASVLFQVLTSLEHGNACDDEDLAMQWGLIQYKTNKFSNFEQCHYTGSKCVAKWFWGSCMRKRKKFCCYDQITTRIFVEGIKAQLGRDWESCNDLTINDLKTISFRPCTDGENPQSDRCFPSAKYGELRNSLLRAMSKGGVSTDKLREQVINSMAIPR